MSGVQRDELSQPQAIQAAFSQDREVEGCLVMEKRMLERARACTVCGVCMKSCPTYRVTGDASLSPIGRLQAAIKVMADQDIDEQSIESLSSCLACAECDAVCPYDIEVSRIVLRSRGRLVERGRGPLPGQHTVIEGILARGNSVNGEPVKRLEWLPEEFPRRDSDTLLYAGCLASYVVRDAATSAYLVLKKLGFDFMLLEDEGCCGTYIYESGRVDFAGELFQKNVDRFKSLGIRRVVCLCPACLTCFKDFYPQVVGETGFAVQHVAEVMYGLLATDRAFLKKVGRSVTYQDPCRLSRGQGVTEEPRKLLEWCGADMKDMERGREQAQCCGAGSGVMTVYRDLSMKVASGLLDMAPTESIVSSCPFCVFCLNRAAKAGGLDKRVTYLTSIVLDSLA